MLIEIASEEHLLSEAINGLLREDRPTSCLLVMPPGFDEARVANRLKLELERHARRPRVAVIPTDTVTPAGYLASLQRQWGLAPLSGGATSAESIEEHLFDLLQQLQGQSAVQILPRFHKILDKLGDGILGVFRTAEGAGLLSTANLAPLPYGDLKRRWQHTHPLFLNSDYGDSHSSFHARPTPVDGLVEVLGREGIDRRTSCSLLELTGGYPEATVAVVEAWTQLGKPAISRESKVRLLSVAVSRVERFVQWLDAPGDVCYRKLVVDLWQGIDTEKARCILEHHPWSATLLEADTLRSEAVGRAALTQLIREATPQQPGHTVAAYTLEPKAREMYARGRYSVAGELCSHLEPAGASTSVRMLMAHTEIMRKLQPSDEGLAGRDSDWMGLLSALGNAGKLTRSLRLPVATAQILQQRYEGLGRVARVVLDASKGGAVRVVDTLAGLRGSRPTPEFSVCLLLMELQVAAGKAIPGDSAACEAVLAMPEQICRVWAKWAMGLDYYASPAGQDHVWQLAIEEWSRSSTSPLQAVAPGGRFVSFSQFTFFLVALTRAVGQSEGLLIQDFSDARRCLSIFEEVRTSSAHALCRIPRTRRERYFALCQEWLGTTAAWCRRNVPELDVRTVSEPLPLVDNAGALVWD